MDQSIRSSRMKANTLNAEYSDFIAFGKFLPLFLRSNISALTPCESAKAIFAAGEQKTSGRK